MPPARRSGRFGLGVMAKPFTLLLLARGSTAHTLYIALRPPLRGPPRRLLRSELASNSAAAHEVALELARLLVAAEVVGVGAEAVDVREEQGQNQGQGQGQGSVQDLGDLSRSERSEKLAGSEAFRSSGIGCCAAP